MQQRPADGEELSGGNMTAVTRVGDTVHRTGGPWTPTVHRLLRHLHDRGVDWVPRPVGLAPDGREILTYLPGTVPQYPLPTWIWRESLLPELARRLAVVHEATRDFDRAGARWQLPGREHAETICHNDFAPYNLVFDDTHALVGVIDWDVVSPGPRVWDLAYLAYRLVPLTAPGNPDAGPHTDAATRRRRLALLCAAYPGLQPAQVARTAIERLDDLAEFTRGRAAAGASHLAGHVQRYREDATWLTRHLAQLA